MENLWKIEIIALEKMITWNYRCDSELKLYRINHDDQQSIKVVSVGGRERVRIYRTKMSFNPNEMFTHRSLIHE